MGARKISSREAVYAELRRRIITLQSPPGSGISENELAADLGVSRTPVREALIKLSDDGLVQVFPQVGTFVALVDVARVRDAQFLREAVEVASLGTLAPEQVLDHDVVASLQANLATQRANLGDDDAFFALDEEFHRGLMRLAGHEGSWAAVASAKSHLDRARRLGMAHLHPNAEMAGQHEAVLAAVVAGDLPGAIDVLRDHLRNVLDSLAAVRAASPELFADTRGARRRAAP